MAELVPCTLVGRHVELQPLQQDHADALLDAGRGVDWSWMPNALTGREDVSRWIATALRGREKGEEFPFVVKLRAGATLAGRVEGDRIVGSTRYMDIQTAHKGVEIGGTWYSPPMQGTAVNPECKYLLLNHAFEDWGAVRVQIKTDVKNERSQRAILKLGAKFEGKLRNHRIRRDGTLRDTMMYSITKDEWPQVKAGLAARIDSWDRR